MNRGLFALIWVAIWRVFAVNVANVRSMSIPNSNSSSTSSRLGNMVREQLVRLLLGRFSLLLLSRLRLYNGSSSGGGSNKVRDRLDRRPGNGHPVCGTRRAAASIPAKGATFRSSR